MCAFVTPDLSQCLQFFTEINITHTIVNYIGHTENALFSKEKKSVSLYLSKGLDS